MGLVVPTPCMRKPPQSTRGRILCLLVMTPKPGSYRIIIILVCSLEPQVVPLKDYMYFLFAFIDNFVPQWIFDPFLSVSLFVCLSVCLSVSQKV